MSVEKPKHKMKRRENLMYKGCEPHWECVNCGECIPFHCFTKEQCEQMDCDKDNVLSFIKHNRKERECKNVLKFSTK